MCLLKLSLKYFLISNKSPWFLRPIFIANCKLNLVSDEQGQNVTCEVNAKISRAAFRSELQRFAGILPVLTLLCSSLPMGRAPFLQTNTFLLMFQYFQTLRKNWPTAQLSWERRSSWLAKLQELPSHPSAGTKVRAATHEMHPPDLFSIYIVLY